MFRPGPAAVVGDAPRSSRPPGPAVRNVPRGPGPDFASVAIAPASVTSAQRSWSDDVNLNQWLYAGGHPNRLARLLNRGWAVVWAAGLWPNRMNTLEVRGRRTGRRISLPVVVADYEGDRYLVAMLGEGAGWVLNVRAARGRAVLRHGEREAVWLEEVEPDERVPIIQRYLEVAPAARAHFPVDWRAPPASSSESLRHTQCSASVPQTNSPGSTRQPRPRDPPDAPAGSALPNAARACSHFPPNAGGPGRPRPPGPVFRNVPRGRAPPGGPPPTQQPFACLRQVPVSTCAKASATFAYPELFGCRQSAPPTQSVDARSP